MSGLAVGHGNPQDADVKQMIDKISHRGPDISGTVRFGRTCMAQNYLKADLPPDARDVSVPLAGDSI
ncbi:MAG: hypothetical protein P8182_04235, partial [Deltaproteobacteria bacterium]